MKKGTFKSLLFAVFCGFCAFGATAATSLFSNYGQIQNVQNYSTNPFWTPNSPYNQRLPQPVYVQGADLTAEDCFKVVQSLVSVQCMARDNCKDTTLADIRPTIMVQLSNLPGNNYVSACSGYIDGVFESYVAQFGNTVPNRAVAFPNATEPNQNLNNNNTIQIQNPYKQEIPQWQQEIKERSQELQELQQQNGAGSEHLSATDFPKTYNDLSFSEKKTLKEADYAQYKGKSAYVVPDFKNTKEWCEGKGSGTKECKAYTNGNLTQNNNSNSSPDKPTSPNSSASDTDVIAAIVAFLDPRNNYEKTFFTDLATDFVSKAAKDDNLILNNPFVYDFLASKDASLMKYQEALKTVSGTAQSEELRIDIDWEDIKIQISTLFDAALRRRGALVCENNRSYQIGLDTAIWIATIAAAIASVEAGGSGGIAIAGGRAALGSGLKALAKGVSLIGLKAAAKSLTKTGGKQIVKGAVKAGLKKNMQGWALPTVQKKAARDIAKKAGANLATKRGMLFASGAVTGAIYETVGSSAIASNQSPVKKSFAARAAGVLYSWLESDESIEFINCQDLDYDEGCYTVCGHGQLNDDLNTKVFKPILGHYYCVSEADFTLYDVETNKPLMMDNTQYSNVTQKIRSVVQDSDKCDWNEDDIDMYFGSYIYDPDTMEPSTNMIIEEVIRIDD